MYIICDINIVSPKGLTLKQVVDGQRSGLGSDLSDYNIVHVYL